MLNSILPVLFFLLEILDEEEFGEAATNLEYDEDAVNNAAELGFLVSNPNKAC